jgi:hypothetical protein
MNETNETIIKRVTLLAQAKGEKPTTSMKAAGVGYNFFVDLRKGQKPSYDKIVMLADYFEVSTDYLLGKNDDSSKPHYLPFTHDVKAEILGGGALRKYPSDPDADLWEMRRVMAERPEMKVLFNLGKSADVEAVNIANAMLEKFKRDSEGNDN